jgi:hypothetical protein
VLNWRFFCSLLIFSLLFGEACFAESADSPQRSRLQFLYQLATTVKELSRCTAVISVEDLAAFQPISEAYNRKTDELAKAIEEFGSRYATTRSKNETVFGFKYRIWEASLQAGIEKARPVSALNRGLCIALTH